MTVGGLVGAVVGSFLATILLRWPRGETVLRGRSRCDHCASPLPPLALLPILSWLVQRGRCGSCGGRIALVHPVIELLAAGVGMVAAAVFPGDVPASLAAALMGWLLLLIAAFDLRHFWLPDALTAWLAASGLAVNALGLGPGLPSALPGLVAGYASLWLVAGIYRRLRGREGLGGGDPKLFGAIGAWLGWEALPLVLLGASLAGLAAAVAVAASGRRPGAAMRLPFGVLLATVAWPAWLAMGG